MSATKGVLFALSVAAAAYATPAGARQSTPDEKKAEPFAFADFPWLTGNARTKESPINTNVFTGEFRVDTNFTGLVARSAQRRKASDVCAAREALALDFRHVLGAYR